VQPVYAVGPITVPHVDQAFPLVRLVAPRLGIEEWRTFCRHSGRKRPLRPNQDDIVVAVNGFGYVQGLCISALRGHVVHGRILDVSVFVVTSVADEIGVAIDLLRHLRALAQTEGCDGIRLWVREHDDWARHLDDHEIEHSDRGLLMIVKPDRSIVA
jgi:hypothetical protein